MKGAEWQIPGINGNKEQGDELHMKLCRSRKNFYCVIVAILSGFQPLLSFLQRRSPPEHASLLHWRLNRDTESRKDGRQSRL